MMDLSSAVRSCSKEYKVTRHVSVSVENGRKVNPRTKEVTVDASITPLTGKDIRRLGGGQRSEGSILIISIQELFTTESSVGNVADIIHRRGTDYQVSTVKDWDIGNFYECVGTKVQR